MSSTSSRLLTQPTGAAPATGDAGGPAVLDLDAVSRSWNRGRQPVLRDVSLQLEPGVACWIGGRNGAGKTTLLRIAAGMITPDKGTVRLLGLDPERKRRQFQRQIGFMSAGNTGLYARLSVKGHLDYWSRLCLLSRDERRDAIARTLERFELVELAGRRADRLSLGQRQRVRLAMVFLHEPNLLLLDEPANSLDEEGIAVLVGAVRETVEQGGAAIWCSPTGERQQYDFDRSMRIDDGRLEELE